MGLTKEMRIQCKTSSVKPNGFFVRKKSVVAPLYALISGTVQEKSGT